MKGSIRAIALSAIALGLSLGLSLTGCLPPIECNIGADCPSGVCGADKRCVAGDVPPPEPEPEPELDASQPDAPPDARPDGAVAAPRRPLRLHHQGLRWAPAPAGSTPGGQQIAPGPPTPRQTPSGLRLRGRVSP